MKESHRKLWREMLTAEMNCEYFSTLASRFSKWDKGTKVFMAIMSSGVVAGWAIFNDPNTYPHSAVLWRIASGLATATAIALPILNLSKKVEWATALKVAYQSAANDYEFIWLKRETLAESDLLAEIKNCIDKEKALASVEAHFPEKNNRLLRRSQQTVIRRRNLIP